MNGYAVMQESVDEFFVRPVEEYYWVWYFLPTLVSFFKLDVPPWVRMPPPGAANAPFSMDVADI
jgi:hypothetical protein